MFQIKPVRVGMFVDMRFVLLGSKMSRHPQTNVLNLLIEETMLTIKPSFVGWPIFTQNHIFGKDVQSL